MNVAIRADASVEIGSGHVMRCLTLADELREGGAKALFLCREHEGHLCKLIGERGFAVGRLPAPAPKFEPADSPAHAPWLGASCLDDVTQTRAAIHAAGGRPDWLVVDHYALDHCWENSIRKSVGRIAVIDDLADRKHDCDVLIDQNCIPGAATRYESLVSARCEKLIGPRFTLIRPEFRAARASRQFRDGAIRRALIFFGSVDAANHTSTAIQVIRELNWPGLEVDVIAGDANPWRENVRVLCSLEPGCNFHRQLTNIAPLMATADLAIGAGGFASYEFAYMGLPSVLLPLTAIQEEVSAEIAARGAAISLGRRPQLPRVELKRALQALNLSPARCREMGLIGQTLLDGYGAQRVTEVLLRSRALQCE